MSFRAGWLAAGGEARQNPAEVQTYIRPAREIPYIMGDVAPESE
jgi:hypothetical protein